MTVIKPVRAEFIVHRFADASLVCRKCEVLVTCRLQKL